MDGGLRGPIPMTHVREVSEWRDHRVTVAEIHNGLARSRWCRGYLWPHEKGPDLAGVALSFALLGTLMLALVVSWVPGG